jgi:alpha-tubulin suppressor-like RCC1 family protein
VSNVVAIAAGGDYDCALALQSNGTVVRLLTGSPMPNGLSNITAIAVSEGRDLPDLALRHDGTVVLLTEGVGQSEMRPPPGLSNVVGIAAGYTHYLALKRDGTVFGWGGNANGEVTGTASQWAAGLAAPGGTILSNVVAIAASQGFSVALKREGTVVAWGQNARGQTDVPAGLSGVVSIAVGWQHCLAITTNTSGLVIGK